jgi:flagellar motor switch protein FliN/FliY
MPLEQVLHLKPGSMMNFQKPIDAPAELLVNNKSIASGQVIQSNERYGIRLTHVGDPLERVRSLQSLTSTRHA